MVQLYQTLNKNDWKQLNQKLLIKLFQTYCYSNVDEFGKQGYTWLMAQQNAENKYARKKSIKLKSK